MGTTYGSRYPALDVIRQAIEDAHPGTVVEGYEHRSETTLVIWPEQIRSVALFLRDAGLWRFALLADIAGVDWPGREKRFEVVYNLYSVANHLRLRLKVRVAENEPVPSVVSVWSSANWHEREVFDMFGVTFTDHPDLRRILMPEDWQGHPQRKDYPLEGPGELLMENPIDWLKLRQARDQADLE